MNKKGFTLVELLVSIVLISTIAYFLFQIIFVIRDIYVDRNIKSEVYIETSNISNIINKDILSKQKDDISLSRVFKVNDDEIDMVYSNNELMIIKINRDTNTISYANYSVDISKDVNIGNIELYYNYDNTSLEKNGVLYIKIPITKNKTDFSIVILARYDSTKLSTNATHLVEAEEEEEEDNPKWDFEYTGDVQSFTAAEAGVYQIELWGASGSGAYGGKGGYTKGNVVLASNQKLYVYVGQNNSSNTPTFNALNQTINNTNYNSGGGSTDIRTTNGNWYDFNSIKSRVMVAAGGGGYCAGRGENELYSGGSGGGLTGYNSSLNGETAAISYGATQTGAGAPGTWQDGGAGNRGVFGSGGSPYVAATNNYRVSGGGGGGYYGGSSGPVCSGDCSFSASGGSSYISGHAGSLAIDSASTSSSITLKSGCTASSTSVDCSTHYSGLKFTDTVMIDGAGYNWTTTKGSQIGMPKYNGTEGTMDGNIGNGYARITLLSKLNLTEVDLNLSGRTLGTPSSTAHTPENKRTWNLNTYVVNYNRTQNYYCLNTNVNYTYDPPDNLYVAMTKTGCGGGYGFGIPVHIDTGKYLITYNANEWTHLAVNLYASDGTYLGNAVLPDQFNVSAFYFEVPSNAYYTVISLPCNYDYGNGNRDATYSNIHLYKLD